MALCESGIWEGFVLINRNHITGHTAEVRDVAFPPDGKYIVTTSFDGTARLWFTDILAEALVVGRPKTNQVV
jgi:WD40 repeat protein